jgi:CcmD family protein
MNFLYSAYIVTWVIHIAYLVWLARGYSNLREEVSELEKE